MKHLAAVCAGVAALALALVAMPAAALADGTPLAITAISLDASPPTTGSVVLPDDWGGHVLHIAGVASDTSSPAATIGSTPCTNVALASAAAPGFQLDCVLPILSGGPQLDLTVSMGGQSTTLQNAVDLPVQPSVSRVAGCAGNGSTSTVQCPPQGGLTLTVDGSGLAAPSLVLVGAHICPSLGAVSDTETRCVLPPGSGTQPLTVITDVGVAGGPTVGYGGLPLAAPTNVTATAGDGSATVSWSTALDPNATAFRVTPTAGGSALPSVTFAVPAAGAPPTMTAVVGGLANGAATTFTVAAETADQVGGESAPSAPVTPAGPPAAPTGLAAQRGQDGMHLSWTAPADDGGSPVTGYTVTPYLDGAAQQATTVQATSAVLALPHGTYVFTVSAANAAGAGPASAPSAPTLEPGGRG